MMSKHNRTIRAVLEFLVITGPSSPKDVGVCVLEQEDGRGAWQLLNHLVKRGYVRKIDRARYAGVAGVACVQQRFLQW